MTTSRLEQHLMDHFNAINDRRDKTICSARCFADAGVLTEDSGFVLRFTNGQEFQITIVDSTPRRRR